MRQIGTVTCKFIYTYVFHLYYNLIGVYVAAIIFAVILALFIQVQQMREENLNYYGKVHLKKQLILALQEIYFN